MIQPFLLRFARRCNTKNGFETDSEYFYDDESDMIRWKNNDETPLLIDSLQRFNGKGPKNPPSTKKCELESGEDQKDRRMWN